MKNSILWKTQNIIITFLFLMAVFIPFVLGVISPDKTISQSEKRSLAQLPAFPGKADDFKEYPGLFDSYYSDHFGLRNFFVTSYKKLKYRLGDSPSKDVTIGKDGWLFLGSILENYSNNDDPFGDYRNINLYSQEELKQTARYLSTVKEFLSAQGIQYIFIIAPNKHTIYYDKFSEYIVPENEFSAADQIVNYLREHTYVTVVDLREPFLKAKSEHQLFYKSDTHWNHFGANVAQYEIMKNIELMFPGKIHAEYQRMSIHKKMKSGDLGILMGIYDLKDVEPEPVFNADEPPFKILGKIREISPCISSSEKGQLKALVFRDSFFNLLVPYFARKLKKSTYVWDYLDSTRLFKLIEQDKPDIVIEEWVERKLPHVPGLDELCVLNQIMFDKSNTTLFSNEWKEISVNKYIDVEPKQLGALSLRINGKYPIVILPELEIEQSANYIVKISIEASDACKLTMYNSDVNKIGTSICSQRSKVDVGQNDIYLLFDQQNLGNYFRIGFENAIQDSQIKITELDIKKNEK
jgi:hypothetical protein